MMALKMSKGILLAFLKGVVSLADLVQPYVVYAPKDAGSIWLFHTNHMCTPVCQCVHQQFLNDAQAKGSVADYLHLLL